MAAQNTKSVTADETVVLTHGKKDAVSTVVLQGIDTGWSGTVIIKAASPGTTDYVPISYKRRSLIAAASDDTVVSDTITDTAFLIEIDAAGLDVVAVCTRSAGTLVLNWATVTG
jgi:hypothetical protein